ncbi:hypothetical protein BCO37747_03432 [Burkholderia contaminans]|nr:hypothetical protein SK875_A00336 [Burkholderia contaminans]VWB35053.1 hypothetical protein BCO23253_01539 [Burkholderia contaminans]VWD14144.1 hypothetical protein BCO37747_03432 [Burkholderia contaminans]
MKIISQNPIRKTLACPKNIHYFGMNWGTLPGNT